MNATYLLASVFTLVVRRASGDVAGGILDPAVKFTRSNDRNVRVEISYTYPGGRPFPATAAWIYQTGRGRKPVFSASLPAKRCGNGRREGARETVCYPLAGRKGDRVLCIVRSGRRSDTWVFTY